MRNLLLGLTLLTPLSAMAATHADQLKGDGFSKPDYYRYLNTAYPSSGISPQQSEAARAAFANLAKQASVAASHWTEQSYSVATVPAAVTYTGRGFTAAGRSNVLALTPGCADATLGICEALVGAAGGGVWIATNPFAGNPHWAFSSAGLTSNAIGSIAVDPNSKGQVIYVGTGEQNASGDSEAGVGVFKTLDGGMHWTRLVSTVPVTGLSVASIAIDPRDSNHLYFGTASALHGSAASADPNVPPGTPPTGLFESHDGGATFARIYTSGTAHFKGSVMQVVLDPSDYDTVYASVLGVGVVRSSMKLDGTKAFQLAYATRSPNGTLNDGFNRSAFSLVQFGNNTRIYLGDSIDGDGTSFLYRADNTRVRAGALSNGGNNPGWKALSSSTPGTLGYGSYNFCEGQCFYDIWVASPPGHPETVWFGGSMNYNEIFQAPAPSNGRAVMRSNDAGASFTDMTRDIETPSAAGMHPDQHAVAFNPLHPDQILAASDGGIVRTSGLFTDGSAACAQRGLTGTTLTQCQQWLSYIPTRISPINYGLQTLQFQDVEFNPASPASQFIGGTQDNGTWIGKSGSPYLIESVGGDGGLAGYDAVKSNTTFHTYYGTTMDVNFTNNSVLGWNYVSQPLAGSGEASQFYMAAITDPVVSGTIFAGLQHVWRTLDDGGAPAYLTQHCNEQTGDFKATCGDWVALGGDLTGTTYGTDLAGGDVVKMTRFAGDQSTMISTTTKGRIFLTTNANAAHAAKVVFTRIDNATSPIRNVSGIAFDPADATHAAIAFTGYGSNTPTTPGHVFDVTLAGTTATYTDISYNIGDMPVTALVRDSKGDLFAGTDFGVIELKAGTTSWVTAAAAFPYTAVYQLKITPTGLIYAATHGRGIWTLATE